MSFYVMFNYSVQCIHCSAQYYFIIVIIIVVISRSTIVIIIIYNYIQSYAASTLMIW